MFNIFQLKNNHLLKINDTNKISSLNKAIWIDILQSNNNKYEEIKGILDQHIIKLFELKNTTKTNRFFKNKYGLYIRSLFFSYNDQDQVNNSIVSFIIYNERLYTVRNEKFPVFCIYQKTLHDHLLIDGNAYELLLNLFEIKIDDLANKIEYIYSTLETLNLIIMNRKKIEEYDHALSKLTTLENISWKIHINLLDTERAIKFLIRKTKLPLNQLQYANEILKDTTQLLPHNECIFKKVSFLTQAAIGFISIEQNRIIKIFSVVFLPPTLIASSYGMNFEFMPELKWSFGYPSAIILMILAGFAPYLYFKYKNWL